MAEPPSSKVRRVLVVDDEPEVTYALQAYFLGKGYEMLTALDGIEAMRHLRQHPIDLVLLDMKMPGVNGVEVLKFIHAQSPQTKVIVVTGYDEQFHELVERLGVDGFLIKPFGIEALTGTIEEVLMGRHDAGPLPSVEPEPAEPLPPLSLDPFFDFPPSDFAAPFSTLATCPPKSQTASVANIVRPAAKSATGLYNSTCRPTYTAPPRSAHVFASHPPPANASCSTNASTSPTTSGMSKQTTTILISRASIPCTAFITEDPARRHTAARRQEFECAHPAADESPAGR